MATISNYNKHLKLSERIKIESALNNNKSFRTISRDINKGVSTISREIENRRYKEKGNYFNGIPKNVLNWKKLRLYVTDALMSKRVGQINFFTVLSTHNKIMKKF